MDPILIAINRSQDNISHQLHWKVISHQAIVVANESDPTERQASPANHAREIDKGNLASGEFRPRNVGLVVAKRLGQGIVTKHRFIQDYSLVNSDVEELIFSLCNCREAINALYKKAGRAFCESHVTTIL
jgi:hypothetical protein